MNQKTWTTADGRGIPISEMDDRHLVNTVQMIDRRTRAGVFNLLLLKPGSLVFRSEPVQQTLTQLYYELLPAVYDDLVAELRWRQIAVPVKAPEAVSAKLENKKSRKKGIKADLMILDDPDETAGDLKKVRDAINAFATPQRGPASSPRKRKVMPKTDLEPLLQPRSRKYRGFFL